MIFLNTQSLQGCVVALALSSCAGLSQAAVITGLKNTGAESIAGAQDLNYFLSASPGTAVIIGGHGWDAATINSLWDANTVASQWLTPEQDGAVSLDPTITGMYTWTLSFDLTGFDQATASFSARYRTDNAGTVSLNGTNLGADITDPQSYSGSVPWKSFTAGSGLFQAGVNVLSFTVQNDPQSVGNPSGLRVEFVESSVMSAVPETEALGLALAGIGVVAVSSLRRRKTKVC